LANDLKAFDELMRIHENRVYNLALRMSGNAEDAADLTQECFLRAFTSLRSFRGEAAFSTWLYRIATNVCLDQLKRRARRQQAEPRADGDGLSDPLARVADPGADVDESILCRERQEAVQAALSSLPEHQRATLVLYDLEGFSYEQIAQLSGSSLGTVKSRLNRARLALKSRLEPVLELFSASPSQTDH